MALLAWDSFDYLDTAHLVAYYDEVESGASIVSGGRCSTNCLRTQGAPGFYGVTKGVASTGSVLLIGVAIKRISGSNPGALFKIWSGSTPIHTVYLNNDGSLYGQLNPDASFPATAWTTPGGLFASNAFHHLQLKLTFDGGSSGRVQIRVDGALTDTYDSGSIQTVYVSDPTTYTGISIGGMNFSAGNLIYWDDLYILDGSGTHCNDFLGDKRVEALEPTADGTTQQWTLAAGATHHAAVDDGDAPDDDTSYVESNTVGQIELNQHEDSALPSGGTVSAVGVKILAKKDQPGDRTIAATIRDTGTNYVGADLTVNQDSYTYRPTAFEVNPATSVAWTIDEVNADEFGVKLTN